MLLGGELPAISRRFHGRPASDRGRPPASELEESHLTEARTDVGGDSLTCRVEDGSARPTHPWVTVGVEVFGEECGFGCCLEPLGGVVGQVVAGVGGGSVEIPGFRGGAIAGRVGCRAGCGAGRVRGFRGPLGCTAGGECGHRGRRARAVRRRARRPIRTGCCSCPRRPATRNRDNDTLRQETRTDDKLIRIPHYSSLPWVASCCDRTAIHSCSKRIDRSSASSLRGRPGRNP